MNRGECYCNADSVRADDRVEDSRVERAQKLAAKLEIGHPGNPSLDWLERADLEEETIALLDQKHARDPGTEFGNVQNLDIGATQARTKLNRRSEGSAIGSTVDQLFEFGFARHGWQGHLFPGWTCTFTAAW
jgi:hypothetical protein